jgi:hypothetical protein
MHEVVTAVDPDPILMFWSNKNCTLIFFFVGGLLFNIDSIWLIGYSHKIEMLRKALEYTQYSKHKLHESTTHASTTKLIEK